jgi:YCII-related domain
MIASESLADQSLAKHVIVHDRGRDHDRRAVRRGEGTVGGFYLVGCDSIERATEIAAHIPEAETGVVEVRPVRTVSGLEMCTAATEVKGLLHALAPQVVGRLVRLGAGWPASAVTKAAGVCYIRNMAGPSGDESERFLLLSVSTAGGPPSLRVQVWRKLRSLGALYLQQSVCLLPAQELPARQVRRLLARVLSEGGSGRVITIAVPDAQERAALVAEFNAARDAEYAEVLERTPAMLAEIAAETARGRASYAEVEESEADLDRFRAWLAKIVARDYFNAPGRAAAEAAVAQCAQALAQFETAALSADTGTAHATAPLTTDGPEFTVEGS